LETTFDLILFRIQKDFLIVINVILDIKKFIGDVVVQLIITVFIQIKIQN